MDVRELSEKLADLNGVSLYNISSYERQLIEEYAERELSFLHEEVAYWRDMAFDDSVKV